MALHLIKMKNEKHYYTELHADGFKYTNKFSGFDSACAHFSTDAKIGSLGFIVAQSDAVKLIGDQQVSHGWTGFTIGKTFEQNGSRAVNSMSPEADYHSGTFPTYREVHLSTQRLLACQILSR